MAQEELREQDKIRVIEDDVDAVRKLPDTYIGALNAKGFLNMLREILQNSSDVINKRFTNNLNITMSYDERNHNVIVEDNGPGLALDMLTVAFGVLHASSNYDKEAGSGNYSSGKNGMGGTIVNYLSKFFVLESFRADGTAAMARYEEGRLVEHKKIKCPKGKTGLRTSFSPTDMVYPIDIDTNEILDLVWKICNLSRIGTTITFNWIDKLGRSNTQKIVNKNGIYELLSKVCEKPVINPIHFVEDNGTMKIEFLLTYDIKNMDDMDVIGFVNTCPTTTIGSMHTEGFIDGVIRFFRNYMNKIYLAGNKKKNLQITAPDIRTGLRAVVSAWHLFPLFTGQSKETFSKQDMKPFATDCTIKALEAWAQNNPNDLQKICKYLKDVAEIRLKSEGEKIKMTDKYTASVVTGLPAKFKKPNKMNKPFELIITEGDSAASGIENNRDKETQGIFPIRGKMPNAFTTATKSFFQNEEVASILNIIGYKNYTSKFDPDQLRVSKIIIMSDADADGSHIECLVLMMFLRYLPFVIEKGVLYGAKPPLYGLRVSKDEVRFFNDNYEYVEYVQNSFCKMNEIHNYKNQAMTKREIIKTLGDNIDYVEMVEKVCDDYSINPYLLEFILFNIKNLTKFDRFKKNIESNFRFCKVTRENGIFMIRGLVDRTQQTVFCTEELIKQCMPIYKMIEKSSEHFVVNHKRCTLYGLMKLFKEYEPKITRYKGLGEMPPKLLGISTVIPGYGRTLRQYTIDNVKKEVEYVRMMQDDKAAFLKDIGTIKREDII